MRESDWSSDVCSSDLWLPVKVSVILDLKSRMLAVTVKTYDFFVRHQVMFTVA